MSQTEVSDQPFRSAPPTETGPRWRECLNPGWRFIREDIAAADSVDFDDRHWQQIGLPHTFDLPYFRTPEFFVGVGWYRRIVHIARRFKEQRVFLECLGAFQVADVFVNGQRVGMHRGGYTPFNIDITAAARIGENVIAICVNNRWDPMLAPRAGEHIFCGGLYRDVFLNVVSPTHFRWNATKITTPLVSRERSIAHVKATIDHRSERATSLRMRAKCFDDSGYVRAVAEREIEIAADSSETIEFEFSVDKAELWHPDHPALHHIELQLIVDGSVVDSTQTNFGFRTIEWFADRGFFLNGERLYLRGANVHQDHAGWGIAITQNACRRDVELMKDAGFNFVRGAHYPHHPSFADACDELGMLYWSECCFWGKGGYGPEGYWNASAYPIDASQFDGFDASAKQALREMIESHFNHPSILCWSMTNEAFFTYNLEEAKRLMGEMVALSHEIDPTRPAAIGGAQRGHVDRIGDIAGYNGDGARLFIDPGVPNMISEYGAIAKAHDAFEPFFGDLQTEKFPWRAGEAIWAGFDYGSIAGRQGLKGIVDHQRVPKASWHWYRKNNLQIEPDADSLSLSDKPAVALKIETDREWIIGTDARDDCQLIISAIDEDGRRANFDGPIKLSIDAGPGEFPTGRSITFDGASDVSLVGGRCAIAMRSYQRGVSVIRARAAGLTRGKIIVTTYGRDDSPEFIAGETSVAAERPYSPPPVSETARIAMNNAVNVARDRPSRASSELPNHPARNANSPDANLCWYSSTEHVSWWQVDLEGFYQLASCRIVFAEIGRRSFTVSILGDTQEWTTVIDRRESVRSDATRNEVFPPGMIARYVRITFSDMQNGIDVKPTASLRDVELFGVLSVR